MARTTLDLDAGIVSELRKRGRTEGKSLGRVASELLARALDETSSPRGETPLLWTTGDLGAPRVDLEDRAALQIALDEGP